MSVLSRQSILRAIEGRRQLASLKTFHGLSVVGDRPALVIDPFDPEQVQADGVDLRLGPHFADLDGPLPRHEQRSTLYLEPAHFVLGSTLERVEIPLDMTGNLLGRSSIGRLGVLIHCTAGSIDPGFRGHVTLELINLTTRTVELPIGISIAKLQLLWLDQPGQAGYQGRYQDQGPEPVPSRLQR